MSGAQHPSPGHAASHGGHHDGSPQAATAADAAEHDTHEGGKSERYELQEIFPEEAPENLHFISVAGQLVVVVLLLLALGFAFSKL